MRRKRDLSQGQHREKLGSLAEKSKIGARRQKRALEAEWSLRRVLSAAGERVLA